MRGRLFGLLMGAVIFTGLLAYRSLPNKENADAARGLLEACYNAGREFYWGCGVEIRKNFEANGNPAHWKIVSQRQERDNRRYVFVVDVDYGRSRSRDTVLIEAGPNESYGSSTYLESYESIPQP